MATYTLKCPRCGKGFPADFGSAATREARVSCPHCRFQYVARLGTPFVPPHFQAWGAPPARHPAPTPAQKPAPPQVQQAATRPHPAAQPQYPPNQPYPQQPLYYPPPQYPTQPQYPSTPQYPAQPQYPSTPPYGYPYQYPPRPIYDPSKMYSWEMNYMAYSSRRHHVPRPDRPRVAGALLIAVALMTLACAGLLFVLPYAADLDGPVSVDGTVLGPTGMPVSHALIEVVGTTHSTNSDRFGEFFLNDVPAGEYVVRASAVGFGVHEVSIYLAEGFSDTIEFNLPTDNTTLETESGYATQADLEGVILGSGGVCAIFGGFTLMGGIYARKQKYFAIGVIGGVFGIAQLLFAMGATTGITLLSSLAAGLAAPALLLLMIGRNEFERPRLITDEELDA